jgi:hypothetical protein
VLSREGRGFGVINASFKKVQLLTFTRTMFCERDEVLDGIWLWRQKSNNIGYNILEFLVCGERSAVRVETFRFVC